MSKQKPKIVVSLTSLNMYCHNCHEFCCEITIEKKRFSLLKQIVKNNWGILCKECKEAET